MDPLFRHKDPAVQQEIVNIYRWLSTMVGRVEGLESEGGSIPTGTAVVKLATEVPLDAQPGWLWFNPSTGRWRGFNGATWDPLFPQYHIGVPDDGGVSESGSGIEVGLPLSFAKFSNSDTEPSGVEFGWIWYQPSTGVWRVYNGTRWDQLFKAVYGGASQALGTSSGGGAPTDVTRLQVSSAAPTSPKVGQFFLDSDTGVWLAWNGSAWDQLYPWVYSGRLDVTNTVSGTPPTNETFTLRVIGTTGYQAGVDLAIVGSDTGSLSNLPPGEYAITEPEVPTDYVLVAITPSTATVTDGAVAVAITHTYAPISAGFTADVTSGVAPLTVTFTDQSTGGPTSWLWDFGDGQTSTDQNPTHEYNSVGSFSVSLTVSAVGKTDSTSTRSSYIATISPTLPGVTWTGKAKVPGSPAAVAEAGGKAYVAVNDGGTGKVFWSLATDLATWTECSYTGGTMAAPTAMVALSASLMCLFDANGVMWRCSDGATWAKTSTFAVPAYGTAQLVAIDSEVVAYYPSQGALASFGGCSVWPIHVPTATAGTPVTTGFVGGLVHFSETMALSGSRLCIIINDSIVIGIDVAGMVFSSPTVVLSAGDTGRTILGARNGAFYLMAQTGAASGYASVDGTTWTQVPRAWNTGVPHSLLILSRLAPNEAFLVAYQRTIWGAQLDRTLDNFASVTNPAGFESSTVLHELSNGSIIAIDSGGSTFNVWQSA